MRVTQVQHVVAGQKDEVGAATDGNVKNEPGKKKGSSLLSFLFNLEREKRLELSTYTLARYRSTN